MKIAMFEGYGFGAHRRRRRRHSRRRTAQQSKLARAARACRGKSRSKFQECMRKKLRGRR